MIELLAQLAQPVVVAQHQTIFRDDFTRGCPGFTPQQNQDIGYAAANHLSALSPQKADSLTIFFTREFSQMEHDPFSGREDPNNGARLDRLLNFISQPQVHKKYVFFCPNSRGSTTGFWGQAISQISQIIGNQTTQESDLVRQLRLIPVGSVHRGFLYFVGN